MWPASLPTSWPRSPAVARDCALTVSLGPKVPASPSPYGQEGKGGNEDLNRNLSCWRCRKGKLSPLEAGAAKPLSWGPSSLASARGGPCDSKWGNFCCSLEGVGNKDASREKPEMEHWCKLQRDQGRSTHAGVRSCVLPACGEGGR